MSKNSKFTKIKPFKGLEQKIQEILNELCSQNFEELVIKIKSLDIDTNAKLLTLTKLLFERALEEPLFSGTIAEICQVLKIIKVEKVDKNGNCTPVNFRRILINCCQIEFEYFVDGWNSENQRPQRLESKLLTKCEEKLQQAKIRAIGLIIFLGKLYNLGMLTDRIMHDIVHKLLMSQNEKALECLCWLLNIVGKKLEVSTNQKLEKTSREELPKEIVPFCEYFDKIRGMAMPEVKKEISPSVKVTVWKFKNFSTI